ncbi:hypothetical protein [Methanococcoides alaskense]|uniref:Small-conductance mechanosensitive channel n=1 Tax=Methanococcoides alaskense TaxID=325778 RepID=A0AA90ZB51_9EURY|nr:hypothetical protein [Methanococcoides alaskense]MDA0525389.1 hypothetical protein [Methanococcoides alaskense]MDR6221678.1 small-conductance mechanosensitive channel [Methanococcoides alaskense]
MLYDFISMVIKEFADHSFSSSLISIIGFIIVFPYFYKSKVWNDLSDFEKLSISIISVPITFFLIVFPISQIYLLTLNFYYGFDLFSYTSSYLMNLYIIVYAVLLIGISYLRTLSPNALYDNHTCVKKIFMGYFIIFFFLIIFTIDFCLIALISGYREYFPIIYGTLYINILLLLIFSIIHLAIHKKELTNIQSYIKENIELFNNKYKAKSRIIVLVLLIIVPCLFGYILFSYSIVKTGQEVKELSIEILPMNPPKYISAERISSEYYTINPPIALK